MWLAVIGCAAQRRHSRPDTFFRSFTSRLLRAGFAADVTHAIVNGALFDLQIR